jgi:tubulin polyglutamylase TTLL4
MDKLGEINGSLLDEVPEYIMSEVEEPIVNASFDENEYSAGDVSIDDGIQVDDDDEDDQDQDDNDGNKVSEVNKKPPYRDPPPNMVRLRNSKFTNIPAVVFIEYPPELNIKRDDESETVDLGKRQLGYQSHWERICIRNAFNRAGFTKTTKKIWTAMWSKHQNDTQMNDLNCLQKVNHFPSSWCIGRKDRLVRTMQSMYRVHGNEFNFHPASFILPSEREGCHRQINMDIKAALQRGSKSSAACNGGMWIIKPCASSCGKGIQVVNGSQVLAMPKSRKVLVQKYIHDPYLIDGKKFDFRMYCMVTGVDPMRVYIFKEGLTRISTKEYSLKNISDRFAHLTNYSINKKSKEFYAASETGDIETETDGFKWSLPAFWRWLSKKESPLIMENTKKNINDLIIKTMISAESTITPQLHSTANYRTNCFELFGVDVMLDSKLNPHLIEVNISPSLAGSSPLDKRIKGTLIADMLHVVGIYPYDPKLIKQFDEVSLPSTVRINKKTKSSTKVSVRPSSAGYSKPLASQNQNQNGSGTGTDTSIGNPFLFGSMSKMMSSQDDWRRNPQPSNISFQGIGNNDAVWMMLLMVEDEIDRCKSTQFIQAHPTPTTAEHYNRLYFSSRFSDHLLARWVIDGGSKGVLRKFIPQKYLSEHQHCNNNMNSLNIATEAADNTLFNKVKKIASNHSSSNSPNRSLRYSGSASGEPPLSSNSKQMKIMKVTREAMMTRPVPQTSNASSSGSGSGTVTPLSYDYNESEQKESSAITRRSLVEQHLISEAINVVSAAASKSPSGHEYEFEEDEVMSPPKSQSLDAFERPLAASDSQRSGLHLMSREEVLDVVQNGLLNRANRRSRPNLAQTQDNSNYAAQGSPGNDNGASKGRNIRQGSHVMTVMMQRQQQQQQLADKWSEGDIGSGSGKAEVMNRMSHKVKDNSSKLKLRSRSNPSVRNASKTASARGNGNSISGRNASAMALTVRDAATTGMIALPHKPLNPRATSTRDKINQSSRNARSSMRM